MIGKIFTQAGSSVRSATALRGCGKAGGKQTRSAVNDPALHRKTVNVRMFTCIGARGRTRNQEEASTDVYSESLG